jgi:hypothetical protein
MAGPSIPTVKRLFAVASNRCAFPGCPVPLIDPATGEVLAEICHIKGHREAAMRYDSGQTDHERHAFENLLLLCPTHHKLVDGRNASYSVQDLRKMKTEHELHAAAVTIPSDAIIIDLLDRYSRLHEELVLHQRAASAVLQQQLRAQHMERAGPIITYIDDQIRTLRRWRAWATDPSSLSAVLANQPAVLLPTAEAAIRQAPRISPAAYQDLSAADERIRIFDRIVRDIREQDRSVALTARWRDYTASHLTRLQNASSFLEEAEAFLVNARTLLEP